MGKQRGDSNLGRGPWTGSDIVRELRRVGYHPAKHGDHLNYVHPDRPGKVQVSGKWTGVKCSSVVYRGLMRQSGYTKKELLRVLNGLDP